MLVLGGTLEARELAAVLTADGLAVTSSLAGRTSPPPPLAGAVRVGGFGGADGLARWLRAHAVDAVVDATHPFATAISALARVGCAAAGVPLLRLERPAWSPEAGDRWSRATSLEDAAAQVDGLGSRVLLSVGRQGLGAFAAVEAWVLVRCLTAPEAPLPRSSELLLARGPFSLEGERALLAGRAIDLVVTKDSGGAATQAKLRAARERGIPVLLVARAGPAGGEAVGSVAEAAAWAMMRA